ncbi:MAG: cytosolic protein [Chlorobium sp.]|nr:MAG: cytosolic protein [Chlorobium sp.]
MDTPNDQYDSPWKRAVENYFSEFMEFYFPLAHAEIDWAKEYVFLDQELRAVVQDAELGKRFVDKLVRVNVLNGEEKWIYIHVEVQGTKQAEFAKRMFVYNYRIFDRYDRPVASLAVLADTHKQWKPTSYGFTVLGCKLSVEFPVAKLTDYEERLDELLESDNAFGWITAAHILTKKTKKRHQERYEAKLRLVRILYQRHWNKQRIIDLLYIVDWLMQLPEWLNSRVWQELETIEEKEKMEYITSIERIGMAKGMVKGQYTLLKRMLERRFGLLPEWASEKLESAKTKELEAWSDAIFTAPTLEAVFNKSDVSKKS